MIIFKYAKALWLCDFPGESSYSLLQKFHWRLNWNYSSTLPTGKSTFIPGAYIPSVHISTPRVWFLVGFHLSYFCCRNSFTQTWKNKLAELSNFPTWTEILLWLSNKQKLLFENSEVQTTWILVICDLNKVEEIGFFKLLYVKFSGALGSRFNSTSFCDRDLRSPTAMIV